MRRLWLALYRRSRRSWWDDRHTRNRCACMLRALTISLMFVVAPTIFTSVGRGTLSTGHCPCHIPIDEDTAEVVCQ
jgi:hypothetical protein